MAEFLQDFIPVAVGKMLTQHVPERRKGKAVEVHHYLFDSMWNIGNKQFDLQILKSSQPVQEKKKAATSTPAASNGEEETKTIEQPQKEDESDEETKEQVPAEEETKEEKVPKEEMDGRVLEAFYRSLIETVKDNDLPLEPAQYLRDFFSEFVCDEF